MYLISLNPYSKSFIAILEEIINKMIPYISKINDNKDYLTTGLLLEELNVKDFEKSRVRAY